MRITRNFLINGFRAMLAAVFLSAAVPNAQAAEQTLRIGYQKGTPLTLLKAQGALDKPLAARGFKIAWTEFPAGPPLLEAMNAGSIDIGYTGSPPPVFAQAAGSRIVYLAAEPAGAHSEAIIVPVNSPLKSVADLKGHTIAFARGSSSHYLLVAALEKAGLKYPADVKPVFLTPADARAAFEGGKVDAWVVWDPYLAVVQQALAVRTLADYGSGVVQPYSYFLGAPDFVKAHPDVIGDVLAAVARNDVWVTSHRAETIELISNEIGVPAPTVKLFIERSRFGLLPLDAAILGSQQQVADAFYRSNVIPHAVRVADIAYPIHFKP